MLRQRIGFIECVRDVMEATSNEYVGHAPFLDATTPPTACDWTTENETQLQHYSE